MPLVYRIESPRALGPAAHVIAGGRPKAPAGVRARGPGQADLHAPTSAGRGLGGGRSAVAPADERLEDPVRAADRTMGTSLGGGAGAGRRCGAARRPGRPRDAVLA